MATRGWNDVTAAQAQQMGRRTVVVPPKKSKYRNVKVHVDGYVFDSKREAEHYHVLKLRQQAGEIEDLGVHQPIALLAPCHGLAPGTSIAVSIYEADFTYRTVADGKWHCVDAKGKRTDMYKLKAKWLKLQDNIDIEEV